MRRKALEELSTARRRQRRHAKSRFQERFQLDLNRDSIHEIEEKIAAGDAVATDCRDGKTNYLVEVHGALILIGFDPVTHRIVTALPEERLHKLAPELITLARARLLPSEQERVIAEIRAGNARLLQELHSISYYELVYEGCSIKVGYDSRTNALCSYGNGSRKKKTSTGKVKAALASVAVLLPTLGFPPEVAESFQRQIQGNTARFLWRQSNTVTFQQVTLEGEPFNVGYSRTRRALFAYQEPPETKPELRSSARLLTGPPTIIEAVQELVRAGKAECIRTQGSERGSYRAEHDGEVYYFDYDSRTGLLGPWNRGR
jgi:hypothetical protein